MNPLQLYLARSPASAHRAVRHALRVLVSLVGRPGDDPHTLAWHQLSAAQCATIRRSLAERYAPGTVNRILCTLRGVLRAAAELSLADAAVWTSIKSVGRRSGSGHASPLKQADIERMFLDCRDDPGIGGCRDAAVLALMYGAGLRRHEVARLDREHYLDCGTVVLPDASAIALTRSADEAVRAWLTFRGDASGPLLCPVNKAGRVKVRRLSDQALYLIVLRRSQRAGVFLSPDALRAPVVRRRREQPGAPVSLEVPFQGCGPGVITCKS